MCCFQVVGNKYEVKLGVKLAIRNLIQSLKVKYDQQRKQKRRPALQSSTMSINTDATAVNNPSQLLDNTSSVSSITFSSMVDLSSSQARLSRAPKTSTESTHQVDIKKRINNWWTKNNDREDISCDPGKDYHWEISRSPGDVFHCYFMCICGIRFKLTLLDSGVFKLSSFFRHMKEQHAVKTGYTVRSFRG